MKSLYLSFYADLWAVDVNPFISLQSYPLNKYKFNLVKNTDLEVQPEFISYCLDELDEGYSYNITVELIYGNNGTADTCIMLRNIVLNYMSYDSLVEFFEFINDQASIRFTCVPFSEDIINNSEDIAYIELDFISSGGNDFPKNYVLVENFDGLIIG
jgi:hypothetical protein